MPRLIVEEVPMDVYQRLQERAAAGHRSLPEEAIRLLEQALRDAPCPTARLPELIDHEEVSAPCDLPRSSEPVTVLACTGQPRLPDVPAFESE
jgi:plasmid stability protein